MRLLRNICSSLPRTVLRSGCGDALGISLRAHRAGADEIQAIKNKSTKTYAAVRALRIGVHRGPYRNPDRKNSVTDLKSLFDVILPGYLMADSSFETHFRQRIEEYFDREPKTSCPA